MATPWNILSHCPSQSDQYYFNNLDKSLDTYSNYEKTFLVGEFNTKTTDHYLSSFLYQHELSRTFKEKMLKMFLILVAVTSF